MNDFFPVPDLETLATRVGRLIRTSELKVAGKLLASARGNLLQLAEKNAVYEPRYERVAELRNELMEPGSDDFDGKRLLQQLLDEEESLRKTAAEHPADALYLSHALLTAAAAILLVHCQDRESDLPLEI